MTTSAKKKLEMMKMLDLSLANEKKLSDVMNDFQHGIVTQKTDMLSTFDKLNDKNFMENDFRKKVYALFNNDTTQSESFMNKFHSANMNIDDFYTVYSKLSELFKNTLASYMTVYNNAVQLIDNVKQTGTSNQAVRKVKGNSPEDNEMAHMFANDTDANVGRDRKDEGDHLTHDEIAIIDENDAVHNVVVSEKNKLTAALPRNTSQSAFLKNFRDDLLDLYADHKGISKQQAKKLKTVTINKMINMALQRHPTRSKAAIKRDVMDEYDHRLVADVYKWEVGHALETIKTDRTSQSSSSSSSSRRSNVTPAKSHN
jgi:hypothetical protein